MARFLVVGTDERALALTATLERDGHVVSVVGQDRPLGELLGALDHVAIVCWLSAAASPERFLAGAIDSSMRGFVYEPGRWEQAFAQVAERNCIQVAAVRVDPGDPMAWEREARAAIEGLLSGARR